MSKAKPVVVEIKNEVRMPWSELIAAFIDSLPDRKRMEEQCKHKDNLLTFSEFRLLTIGGHRQSGKTESARQLVLSNKKARLINAHADYVEENKTVLKRTIKGLNALTLKDVEILVINQDGWVRDTPLEEVTYLFDHSPEMFHPNFSVIILL